MIKVVWDRWEEERKEDRKEDRKGETEVEIQWSQRVRSSK
jgi:hypothetical protein